MITLNSPQSAGRRYLLYYSFQDFGFQHGCVENFLKGEGVRDKIISNLAV